ncbi:PepSY domain-containing protein [Thiorhodococcus minor]|uniref:Peptidase M4 n=1 Tax=Thiorhodococcus minor TaxID=57489 RepID=A0A6M0JXH8_9GAMM|nr:PepSY domain-containing protein [Thiorhodococcus minor]NEV60815.1 peptidase M4 [Thiorhodococcus minor]
MPQALLIATLGILALFTTARLDADVRVDHDDVKRLRESGKILPMTQVLEVATRIQPGHLVEAELEPNHHGYRYEIKILDAAGHLHELEIDASTGILIDKEER